MKKILFILFAICLFILFWLALKPTEPDPETTSVSYKPQTIERHSSQLEPLEPPIKKQTTTQTALTLDDSDNIVKPFIKENAQGILNWLAPNELIRRFVIAVNALSEGNFSSALPFITHKLAPFKARKDNATGKLTLDPNNEKRLRPLVQLITQIPPATLVKFYQGHQALFEQAYKELGIPGHFNDQLQRLLDQIIACPRPKANASLKQESVAFQYKSTRLESAQPLEKALWRLGDKNLHTLQNYSKKLKSALIDKQ